MSKTSTSPSATADRKRDVDQVVLGNQKKDAGKLACDIGAVARQRHPIVPVDQHVASSRLSCVVADP